MQPAIADIPRPAKRVVVFSSDGGRADRFFEVDAGTFHPHQHNHKPLISVNRRRGQAAGAFPRG